MIKIYDCSQSEKYLGGRIPKDNLIVKYLKQNAYRFDCEFINSASESDVIFTNDIFPEVYNKPRVKRMDGVFSRYDNLNRNVPLNQAAIEADHVIFISEFSKESFHILYGTELKSHSVVLNAVDPDVFYPSKGYNQDVKKAIVVADDWSRPEKRLNEVVRLAKYDSNVEFTIVGKVPSIDFPQNVKLVGFVENPKELAEFMRNSDVMVSLFYKDPCPKTLIQGTYCGLPAFFTGSGGQTEIPAQGLIVSDTSYHFIDRKIPLLKENLEEHWDFFKNIFLLNKGRLSTFNGKEYFEKMLEGYFNILRKYGSH